ncbi:carbon monoxide dehydrogenase subunit G [Pseudomonas sp.]|uniref:SRPBCC family protein n=1 Tax=Pseudomonas sp. TaxID=306 RepID=UPI002E33CF7A|nr:carbon monoxide dehydrogenase subunit G [Pseudomonas sp.]HEX4546952.1 carbon monoxide dehydrogenase subunit G [Pseudomonas sp.]
MDMTGEQRIPAPRDEVWAALNDADVLRACIPGCQELIKRSDTEMTALTILKVGPISAKFTGAVTLSDIDPPNGYRITGEGQGGGAGNARGGAVVRLREDGDETILTYEVEAQISGKLAQLGGRMIDATAKSMSTAFFKKLAAEIDARRHGTGGAPAEAAPAKAGAGRAGPAEVPSAAPPEDPPSPVYAPPHGYPPPPMPAQGGRLQPVSIILLVVLLIVGWYLSGGSAERGVHLLAGQNVSPDFVGAVQLLTILAIGYLLGRSSK